MASVCVRVPTIKHRNIMLELKLREVFGVKEEGVARG